MFAIRIAFFHDRLVILELSFQAQHVRADAGNDRLPYCVLLTPGRCILAVGGSATYATPMMVSQRRTVRIELGGTSAGTGESGNGGQGTLRCSGTDNIRVVEDAIEMPTPMSRRGQSGSRQLVGWDLDVPVVISRMKWLKLYHS